MEANNVEEYLRSARATRTTHTSSVGAPDPPTLDPIQETASDEQPVFFEDNSAGVPAKSPSDCMPRKPPYYPCTTAPQRHTVIHSPPLPELSKEDSKRMLMRGYVPPHSQHTHNGTVDIVTPVSNYSIASLTVLFCSRHERLNVFFHHHYSVETLVPTCLDNIRLGFL